MRTSVRCSCGQLSIEIAGQPVTSHNFGSSLNKVELKQQQDHFSYFADKDIIGTTGEASCKSLWDKSGWQLNSYHCDECDTALFCVLTEADKLIGVATDYLTQPAAFASVEIDSRATIQALYPTLLNPVW